MPRIRQDKRENRNDNYTTVASRRLKTAMFKRDFSGARLSEAADICACQISEYINGKKLPGTRNLAKIAKVLQVSTDWLLGLTDQMEDEDEGL